MRVPLLLLAGILVVALCGESVQEDQRASKEDEKPQSSSFGNFIEKVVSFFKAPEPSDRPIENIDEPVGSLENIEKNVKVVYDWAIKLFTNVSPEERAVLLNRLEFFYQSIGLRAGALRQFLRYLLSEHKLDSVKDLPPLLQKALIDISLWTTEHKEEMAYYLDMIRNALLEANNESQINPTNLPFDPDADVRDVTDWAMKLTTVFTPDDRAVILGRLEFFYQSIQSRTGALRQFLRYLLAMNGPNFFDDLPRPLRKAFLEESLWTPELEKEMKIYLDIILRLLREANIAAESTQVPVSSEDGVYEMRKAIWMKLFGQFLDQIFVGRKASSKDRSVVAKELTDALFGGSRPEFWANLTQDEQASYFKNLAQLMVDNLLAAEKDEQALKKYFVFDELMGSFSQSVSTILDRKVKDALFSGKQKEQEEEIADGLARILDETFKHEEIKNLEEAIKESNLLAGFVREQELNLKNGENNGHN